MTAPRVIIRTPRGVTDGNAGRLRAWVADVEASGIDGVFSGDHISFHNGAGYDGLIHATALAVASERLTIWSAVFLLALRHPVPVARQVASLASLAPGRFMFGVGLGGEDPHELEICGVDPRRRGRRLDAHLDAVRALLAGEELTTDGEFLSHPRGDHPPRSAPARSDSGRREISWRTGADRPRRPTDGSRSGYRLRVLKRRCRRSPHTPTDTDVRSLRTAMP